MLSHTLPILPNNYSFTGLTLGAWKLSSIINDSYRRARVARTFQGSTEELRGLKPVFALLNDDFSEAFAFFSELLLFSLLACRRGEMGKRFTNSVDLLS